MVDVRRLDNDLYRSTYAFPRKGDSKKIWEKIKNNSDALRESSDIVKNKWNSGCILKGITIADYMLKDYENIDFFAYIKLIDAIYNDTDIARLVVDGANNGGASLLLMSLMNPNLTLNEDYKKFAVREAMNKLGTTKYKDLNNNYFNQLFASLSNTQAHGTGAFDIRYYILKNNNWTIEEKAKLIQDFWYNDDDYDNALEEWEWAIINDSANYKGNALPLLDISDLYEYTYEELLKFYGDKKTTDRIWNEINFCRTMHVLRPEQFEKDIVVKRKTS